MKKLLELLGIILLTSNAAGALVANKPNNKAKIKNSLETLNRPKRQAPQKQGKKKKANPTKSSTQKPRNEQPSTSKTDNQVEFIKKEITLNKDYADSIQNMLNGLIDENHLSRLRSLNMGGLISTPYNREPLIKIIEKLNKKMANLLDEQENNNEKILILTLKNTNDENDKDYKSIKLVINLKDFYVQGFINKDKDDKEQYFYFKDSQVKEIKDKDLNIQEPINLGYDSNYSHLIPTADLTIDFFKINGSISALSTHNIKDNNKIKQHLARLVFITSEAMRFRCDKESLEIFANIKNIDELKNNLKNILKDIKEKIFDRNQKINWSDYKEQINNWSKYSEQSNKWREEIWKELIKMKKLNDFICQNKNKIIEIFKKENEEKKILNEIRELFNKEENEKFKELKDNNFLEQFTEIKFREMQMKLVKFFKDSTNDLANKFKDLNISEQNQELTHFREKFDEIKREEINLSLNFENNNGVFLFAVIQDNLDFLKFLLNSGIKIEIKNIEWLEKWKPLHFATQNGNLEIVKLLIEHKAEVNAKNNDGTTPLHLAAQNGHTEIVELLLKEGADVNIQSDEGSAPLHLAAQNGHTETVKLLLDNYADVNARNNDGGTPLHSAVKKGRMKVVEELLTNENSKDKIDVNAAKSNNGVTPLHIAIQEREDDIVKLLLDKAEEKYQGVESQEFKDFINATNKNGKTPLHFAAEYSFSNKVVKLLLDNGADVNAEGGKGKKTALHYAVQYSRIEIVQELLTNENSKDKIDINIGDNEGVTPLHIAAQNGHLAIVKMLINKAEELKKEKPGRFRKFINAINEKGDTPLKLAEEKNRNSTGNYYQETIELLNIFIKETLYEEKNISGNNDGAGSNVTSDIHNQNTKRKNPEEPPAPSKRPKLDNEDNQQTEKNGLDINKIKNQDEVTALHMAVKDGNEELVKFLINELDVDINAKKSNNGKTPLHFAIEERKDDIVKLLLDKAEEKYQGVESQEFKDFINGGKSNNGKTPLNFAAQYSFTNEVVKMLLNKGADVGNSHIDKWTALHYAVQYGHADIVQELLTNENSKNKIDVNIPNQFGYTPLHIATQNGHLAIVKMLINKAEELKKEKPGRFRKFINAINEKLKKTPLDLAEEKIHTETVKFLLDHGAVRKIQDNNDGSAGPNGNSDATNQKTNSNTNVNGAGSSQQHRGGGRIVGISKQSVTSGTQNQNTSGTNHNNLYDVPADGSCLFWSVATAYLLPARSNDEAFRNRFIQLFGELQLSYLSYVQNLFQQFDVENNTNTQTWYQDATAHGLVRIVFRNRVVDYIQSNLDTIPNRDGELTFRSLIQDNNEIASNYLERMRQPSTWGGTPEIIAMSNLLNANISVGTDGPYQPVHQNANDNNIAISYVELEKGSGIHNHYNLDLTPEEERTNQSIVINDNQGNVSGVDITKRPDNLLPTTPKPEANAIKLAVDDHGQHHAIPANNNEDDDANQGNNIAKAPEPTATPLQKDEYHFVDKKTEEKSLKNDENLEINLIKNNNKIKQNVPVVNKPINKNIINAQITATKAINQYNALSKEEKLKRLNEINRYYQTLSGNDKKTFKEKLTNTGLAALSGGTLTAYGTKMTVGGTATTSVTNVEAMEMTPLLSTSTTESLAAAETITVAETVAVEGGVIAGEVGTAAALAPETLGLSLVIGGLAIAGTWMYFAFHHHATSDIALPALIHHNVYDNIEKWYKFLAHDKLKIKINKNTWNEIKQNKNSQANIIKIIKNKFVINDHSGWGGSVTNEDFNTLVKAILLHFEQINGYFEILDNENDGFVIITNTEGDWLGIE